MLPEIMLNKDFKMIQIKKNTKFYFQLEHNLVLPGGRDINGSTVQGNVVSIFDKNIKYLVRIVNIHEYSDSDYIFEYSLANIENIKRSKKFDDDFIKKILYLPPIVYDFIDYNPIRTINILTTFIDEHKQKRRTDFLIKMKEKSNLNHININNINDKNQLCKLYDNTKILLNIHQTDHHHTLEEFRILPALCRGVVVISEDIPLREVIPYHKFIVWCNYDNIFETLNIVLNNYDNYYDNIMTNLKPIIENMNNTAIENIKRHIS